MWEFLKSLCLHFARMLIITFTEPHQAALPEASGAPRLCDVTERRCSFLMPTRSFCSETHQSVCCLIGSERWESIAICTPAPKSSLWTCHSRRVTCICLVLHLTKGSPISSGGGGKKKLYTQHSHPVSRTLSTAATRSQVEICVP